MEGHPDRHMDMYQHSNDPARLRISDIDRHRVAEVLRLAAGEGRIDLEELEERLEATYSAKVYADLVPITADLPAHPGQEPVVPAVRHTGSVAPVVSHSASFAVMADNSRRGLWSVPAQHTALAMMGSVTLDLREAQFEAHEVTINALAVMAGIDIIVNAHTVVIVDGFGVMGDFSEARARVPAELSATSPVVRVKGLALMGAVSVRRKGAPGGTRRRFGRNRDR